MGCLVLMGLCGRVLAAELPQNPAELFDLKKVWSARLSFSADQWKELKPEEPEGGFPFGPPGGGGPGRRGGFGPGTFLAGPLVVRLDVDQNGSVTKEEFIAGFEGFFGSWDSEKSGASMRLRSGRG